MALVCLLIAAGSAFAQSATLTATARVNPLEVEVIAPNGVTVGEWFEITANISNLGGETITKAYATIHTDPKLTVRGKKKKVGKDKFLAILTEQDYKKIEEEIFRRMK